MSDDSLSRRGFLGTSLLAGLGLASRGGPFADPPSAAPAVITSARLRPLVQGGVQTGDVTGSRAVVWSRADRPARLLVEWATNERFTDARSVRGPAALAQSAFTASLDLHDLPAGEGIVYRARFESLRHPGVFSAPVIGRFRTPSSLPRPVRVAFSGDNCGQGWGIDASRGGLRMYEALRRAEPDVFIHSGDIIYADQPLAPEVTLDDGTLWRNLVTQAKSHVAETLDDFRGNFAYNLLDENARRFHASVPVIAGWDDHEVADNWYPGLAFDREGFSERSASLLAARAKRALFEFVPVRRHADERGRVYRRFSFGPMLEVFVLDLRSYRGPNTPNRQPVPGADTSLLGAAQLAWLRGALQRSDAVWKVIACSMPVGLVVRDRRREGRPTFEAWANASGDAPSGRELELAGLVSFMKREGIRNTVWVTADVHYAAAHHYAPERAAFTDFDPFWEFVAGPMHAGTFGPNTLDATFGPQVVYSSVGEGVEPNRPPSDDLQFYGTLDADPRTRSLTVGIHDVTGRRLWGRELAAVGV